MIQNLVWSFVMSRYFHTIHPYLSALLRWMKNSFRKSFESVMGNLFILSSGFSRKHHHDSLCVTDCTYIFSRTFISNIYFELVISSEPIIFYWLSLEPVWNQILARIYFWHSYRFSTASIIVNRFGPAQWAVIDQISYSKSHIFLNNKTVFAGGCRI